MIDDSLRQLIWLENDWNYIKGLSVSVESVPQQYIREKSKKFHIERIFSYELYYRWKKTLEKKSNNPLNLLVNAELTKRVNNGGEKFPDMVLHGDYTIGEKQFIICEIKSSRNYVNDDAIKKDLESLRDGIKVLQYHCGVFIYLGGNKSSIIQRLKRIKNQIRNNDFIVLVMWVINQSDVKYELI